jgi:hypothetical protein
VTCPRPQIPHQKSMCIVIGNLAILHWATGTGCHSHWRGTATRHSLAHHMQCMHATPSFLNSFVYARKTHLFPRITDLKITSGGQENLPKELIRFKDPDILFSELCNVRFKHTHTRFAKLWRMAADRSTTRSKMSLFCVYLFCCA